MAKKKISELNAVAAIVDSIFQQVDERWDTVWSPVAQSLQEAGIPIEKSDFVKFNFSLAVIAINFRTAFDIFHSAQAERFFTMLQDLLKEQLGGKEGYQAVINAILKYIEAYNNGILKIRNPVLDVAMLLYYKIGLQNTPQQVVDETYFIPEPQMVEYLSNSLTMFLGKWDMLVQRFDIATPATRAPNDDVIPKPE
jgi:hypothetical protein